MVNMVSVGTRIKECLLKLYLSRELLIHLQRLEQNSELLYTIESLKNKITDMENKFNYAIDIVTKMQDKVDQMNKVNDDFELFIEQMMEEINTFIKTWIENLKNLVNEYSLDNETIVYINNIIGYELDINNTNVGGENILTDSNINSRSVWLNKTDKDKEWHDISNETLNNKNPDANSFKNSVDIVIKSIYKNKDENLLTSLSKSTSNYTLIIKNRDSFALVNVNPMSKEIITEINSGYIPEIEVFSFIAPAGIDPDTREQYVNEKQDVIRIKNLQSIFSISIKDDGYYETLENTDVNSIVSSDRKSYTATYSDDDNILIGERNNKKERVAPILRKSIDPSYPDGGDNKFHTYETLRNIKFTHKIKDSHVCRDVNNQREALILLTEDGKLHLITPALTNSIDLSDLGDGNSFRKAMDTIIDEFSTTEKSILDNLRFENSTYLHSMNLSRDSINETYGEMVFYLSGGMIEKGINFVIKVVLGISDNGVLYDINCFVLIGNQYGPDDYIEYDPMQWNKSIYTVINGEEEQTKFIVSSYNHEKNEYPIRVDDLDNNSDDFMIETIYGATKHVAMSVRFGDKYVDENDSTVLDFSLGNEEKVDNSCTKIESVNYDVVVGTTDEGEDIKRAASLVLYKGYTDFYLSGRIDGDYTILSYKKNNDGIINYPIAKNLHLNDTDYSRFENKAFLEDGSIIFFGKKEDNKISIFNSTDLSLTDYIGPAIDENNLNNEIRFGENGIYSDGKRRIYGSIYLMDSNNKRNTYFETDFDVKKIKCFNRVVRNIKNTDDLDRLTWFKGMEKMHILIGEQDINFVIPKDDSKIIPFIKENEPDNVVFSTNYTNQTSVTYEVYAEGSDESLIMIAPEVPFLLPPGKYEVKALANTDTTPDMGGVWENRLKQPFEVEVGQGLTNYVVNPAIHLEEWTSSYTATQTGFGADYIREICCSPDSKLLYIGGGNKFTTFNTETETFDPITAGVLGGEAIQGMVLSKDGKKLYACGAKGRFNIYDTETKTWKGYVDYNTTHLGSTGQFMKMVITPDQKKILACGYLTGTTSGNGVFNVYNIETDTWGTQRTSPTGYALNRIALTLDGSKAVMSGYQRRAAIYDIETDTLSGYYQVSQGSTMNGWVNIALHDGMFFFAGNDANTTVWDPNVMRIIYDVKDGSNQTTSAGNYYLFRSKVMMYKENNRFTKYDYNNGRTFETVMGTSIGHPSGQGTCGVETTDRRWVYMGGYGAIVKMRVLYYDDIVTNPNVRFTSDENGYIHYEVYESIPPVVPPTTNVRFISTNGGYKYEIRPVN